MADRTLLTWLGQHPVGALRESAGLWSFEYAPEWLRHPEAFALAPALPLRSGEQLDGATHRPVQWYFDNLLPEETQRDLLAGEAGLASADAFGLLAWYGAESAGSLTLLPPETLPSAAGRSAGQRFGRQQSERPGGFCTIPSEKPECVRTGEPRFAG